MDRDAEDPARETGLVATFLRPAPAARAAGCLFLAVGLIHTFLSILFATGSYFAEVRPLALVSMALLVGGLLVLSFGSGRATGAVQGSPLLRIALLVVAAHWLLRLSMRLLLDAPIDAVANSMQLNTALFRVLEATGLLALGAGALLSVSALRHSSGLLRWAPLVVVGTHALAAVALSNPIASLLYDDGVGAEVAIAVNDVTSGLVAASWLLLGFALILVAPLPRATPEV